MPKRIGRDKYYMGIAEAVAKRADCLGTKVGAVIVVDDRIVSTGYNGAPVGVTNCSDGGCPRCSAREKGLLPSGEDLDKCLCVHGEENAILSAARHGIRISGCTIYTTVQPCLGCLRQIIQIKAKRVLYANEFPLDVLAGKAYARLCKESSLVVKRFGKGGKPKRLMAEDTIELFDTTPPSKN